MEDLQRKLIDLIKKTKSETALRRLYSLAQYLYIHTAGQ